MDIIDKIQEELGIDEKKVRITVPRRMLTKAIELEREKEQVSIFENIGKILMDDIEEIKINVARMYVDLQQLKKFSGKMKQEIEEPLKENIMSLRKHRKVLATDAALTEKKVLESMDTFGKLGELEQMVMSRPESLNFLNIVEQFKEQKSKTEVKPKEEKPPEKKEEKKEEVKPPVRKI